MPTPTPQELDNRFSYHAPEGTQQRRYEEIREGCYALAILITTHTPFSREQSTALTYLDQVMFNANAAIARNE